MKQLVRRALDALADRLAPRIAARLASSIPSSGATTVIVPTAAPPAYFVGNDRFYTHTSDGHRIFLDANDMHITLHVLEHGNWEPQVREVMMLLLKPGDTFVDVGGNVGLHALFGASIVGPTGQVHSFEALPRMAELIRLNAEVNGMNNVTVHNLAVADVRGRLKFADFKSHAAMSGFAVHDLRLEMFAKENPEAVDHIEVDATTIDDELVGKRVDLIKADIEGFEALMLKGARRTLTDNPDIALILEWNPLTAEAVLPSSTEMTLQVIREQRFNVHLALFGQPLRAVSADDLPTLAGDIVLTRGDQLRR